MKVGQIWRYPVKSMGGEPLNHACIGSLGIEGDRIVHVEDAHGHVMTARTHPRLLGHHATLNASGEPLVDGVLWSDPKVRHDVVDIVGPDARLVRDESRARFDVLPLLVATDGAIAAFGHDVRRLRPNIVIEGVKELAERDWPGGYLRIGTVIIGVQDLRSRCIMTSYDPDTQIQDKAITRSIYRRFEGKLALNCFVIEGGMIAVDDEVHLVRDRASAESAMAAVSAE